MKKKLAVIVTVLAIIVNFAGCGADDGLIKINVPEEYTSLYSEIDLNESVEKGTIEAAYYNPDDSLTFEVTQQQQENMINKYKKETVEGFDSIAAEEGDCIQDIEFNDTFTKVDITVTDYISGSECEAFNEGILMVTKFHEILSQNGAEYVDISYHRANDGELVHLSVLEFELQ